MTVPATPRRAGPFNGNGVTTSFPFSFKTFDETDISIVHVDADGIETTLILNSDYSVTLNPDQEVAPGGAVTYPISGTPLATSETLSIVGALPYDQVTDLPTGGSYRAQVVENAFDRTEMQIQQLAEAIARALVMSPAVDPADVSTQLPAPEAFNVIGWNGGAPFALQNFDPATFATIVAFGTSQVDLFSGDGVQTDFALTDNPGVLANLDVSIDGLDQRAGVDYTWSGGTTLTFTSPPPAGTDNIQAKYKQALPQGDVDPNALTFSHATTYDPGTVGLALQGVVNVKNAPYNAQGDGATDDTAAIQAAVTAHRYVYLPPGSYKITSTIVVPSGTTFFGAGVASTITPYGCDAFSVSAGGVHVRIEALGLASYSAIGVADPRTFSAVFCDGLAADAVNYVTLRDLYLQGWADGVNWLHTWNSRLDNVTTVNCNHGLLLRGQSVNNSVDGCRLVSNGGIASILTRLGGGLNGEGLMVSNTLMASGTYGVRVEGQFLDVNIVNCTIDLITGDAINVTDCKDLKVSNSWLYAANRGVALAPLGVTDTEGVSIQGCHIEVTSATGTGVEIGALNSGVAIIGNLFKFGGTSQGVYANGLNAFIDGNHFQNTGAGASIYINTSLTTNKIGKNTGVVTIGGGAFGDPEYSEGTWTPTDLSGAGLAITQVSQAHYVKNGRQVTCTLDIQFPVTASGATAQISLPFAPPAAIAGHAGCIGFQTLTGTFMAFNSLLTAGFRFWKPAVSANATNADLSGGRFIITFSYEASA